VAPLARRPESSSATPVFSLHASHARARTRPIVHGFDSRRKCGPRAAQRPGMAQVGVDRRCDDPRLDGNQINAGDRHPSPGVDDDPFVEHVVENIDEAGGRARAVERQNERLPFAQSIE